MRVLLALVVMVAFTAGAMRLPWPFVWVASGWALFCLVWAIRARTRSVKLLALCALTPTLVLGFAETKMQLDAGVPSPTRFDGTLQNPGLWVEHDVLGYAPTPNLHVAARRIVDDEVVYEFTYDYDEHGQRIPPPLETRPAAGAIVCLGCSFTLGEGVPDELTYPYRIGELSGRRYEVRNFGFHGYGPHQALAALQSGWVDEVCDAAPRLVLYLALQDHKARCAGYKSWDPRGPWYRVENGALRHVGRFDERPGPPFGSELWLRQVARKSLVARRFVYEPAGNSSTDTALYEAIVLRMRQEVLERFPGAEFHVLASEGTPPWWESMARLTAAGVPVHRVDAMIPGLAAGQRLPTIPHDTHPSPEVYEGIARFVNETLLP
jgi:hypothetical protein